MNSPATITNTHTFARFGVLGNTGRDGRSHGPAKIPGAAPVLLPDSSVDLVHRDLLTPWQRRKVIQFVEERLDVTIKVDELAALAKLGKSYFSRAFKASFGESPYAYIINRRMDLAKELMETSDLPLTEIALDCGMTDQAHLCKTFRKAFAITPNAWRRSRRIAHSGSSVGSNTSSLRLAQA